ncbi:MAG: hypothetical protein IKC32_04120 [Clostridia bacterium]|nr:hypothetical protein [Clostridia bacterium]
MRATEESLIEAGADIPTDTGDGIVAGIGKSTDTGDVTVAGIGKSTDTGDGIVAGIGESTDTGDEIKATERDKGATDAEISYPTDGIGAEPEGNADVFGEGSEISDHGEDGEMLVDGEAADSAEGGETGGEFDPFGAYYADGEEDADGLARNYGEASADGLIDRSGEGADDPSVDGDTPDTDEGCESEDNTESRDGKAAQNGEAEGGDEGADEAPSEGDDAHATDGGEEDDNGVGSAKEGPTEADYERMAADDLALLKSLFPELMPIGHLAEIKGSARYGALRDLGLSPKEAYLATREARPRVNGRAHLTSSVPRGAGTPSGTMTHSELLGMRELFPTLGDNELHRLHKKVNR